jgi:O-methyltransferase involved in polyketide biosynthesis
MLDDDDDRWHFVSPSVANVARIYDYLLGGKDNFEVDRQAVKTLLRIAPDAPVHARANRMFLGRAIKYLAAQEGICQFIDIGTGLPTMNNVHEVAQSIHPKSRVVYFDYDPVVVTHAQALLATNEHVTVHAADLRQPEDILMLAGESIDFDEPVAILLVAILHFIRDDENPCGIVSILRDAMPSGSYLVVTHVTADGIAAEDVQQAREVYSDATAPVVHRSLEEVTRFFRGLDVISPGVVAVNKWRPSLSDLPSRARTIFYGGAGRKP